MSKEKMVEIQNLYVNFYTQSGVVKAIDGVNLTLFKGETFGLVGETGCGKSVTANSVMKLIPQPPGKIEKGRIFFMPPGGTEEEMQRIQEQINELRSKPDLPKDDPQIKRLEKDLAEQKAVADITARWNLLWKQPASPERDAKISDLDKELYAILNKYDLIPRTKKYMQKIRGKYISMIFQEPMARAEPGVHRRLPDIRGATAARAQGAGQLGAEIGGGGEEVPQDPQAGQEDQGRQGGEQMQHLQLGRPGRGGPLP